MKKKKNNPQRQVLHIQVTLYIILKHQALIDYIYKEPIIGFQPV